MAQNVLFITADQWRGECLSCLGHFVQTPNLDALAGEGVLFTNHFANAAPCGPSRASIHTGLYQYRHGVTFNGVPLDGRHTNWALEARQAGWDPVLFGYTDTATDPRQATAWHEGVLPGLEPIVQLGKSISAPDAWVDWLRGKGYAIPDSPGDLYMQTRESGHGDGPAPLMVPAELHDTWFMVDQVIDYVADRSGWCVHLSLLRPHPPWRAPAPYNGLYPPGDLPSPNRAADPEQEAAQHPFVAAALDRVYQRMSRDDRRLGEWRASYFGLMTEVDHNLGRLFDALKQSGAWDETFIVFTSDHGEQAGDHWMMDKLGYFDESFHVPLIVHNPSPEAHAYGGVRVDEFTEGVDIMPTLLDFLGVDVPEQCDGRSLLAATTAGRLGSPWRTEAYWEFNFGASHFRASEVFGLGAEECSLTVLRDESSKYVEFQGLPNVFFDLANDPRESRNVFSDPAHRSAVEEAEQRLRSRRMAR